MPISSINIRPLIPMWNLQHWTICILWLIPGGCLELARRNKCKWDSGSLESWGEGMSRHRASKGRACRHGDMLMVVRTLIGAQGLQWLALMAIGYPLSLAAELMWHILAKVSIWGNQARWHPFSWACHPTHRRWMALKGLKTSAQRFKILVVGM